MVFEQQDPEGDPCEDYTSPKHHVRNTIRRMGSQKPAESLRSMYLDLGYNSDCLLKPAEYHSYEAIKSLIYEMLPPLFVAPLACMLLEPSLSAGYNVAVHRNMAVGLNPAEYSSTDLILLLIRDFSVNWLCELSVLLWLATRPKSVDPMELALCYGWMFTRYCVIATKYGYYPEYMIEDNRKYVRHKEWHLSALIVKNWGDPSYHVLRESVERAQQVVTILNPYSYCTRNTYLNHLQCLQMCCSNPHPDYQRRSWRCVVRSQPGTMHVLYGGAPEVSCSRLRVFYNCLNGTPR